MENDRIPPHNRGTGRPAAATAAPTAPPPPASPAGGRIADGTGRPVVPARLAVPLVAADPPDRTASRPTAGPYPAGPPVAVGAPGGRDTGGRLPSEDGLPVVPTVVGRVARPGLALAGDTALLMKGAPA
ncbi:hypothetical protein ACFYOF_43025 [Streptomyces sp. NPDC007148]|uniref:hypothetical protein n=1 Tax=unclassified Streptomyces TaxID=2593676 RepID=UPI00342FED68